MADNSKCSDGVLFYDYSLNSKMEDTNYNNSANSGNASQSLDRLKLLYPNVNEDETPLPRSWSSHDKCSTIGLTQNNLRVTYKGIGKSHSDAASVRTAYPIPAACGLYYFEVKIISKGRDGYMGIGLTTQHFKMNRLPGWDKQSYGYHGDDGNSFSSSGNGQPYGPTFTTSDVIGCGVNLVDNVCFYTKNGHYLGIAFSDLPSKLYPTVGLQTPGEEVDANFGQEPFKFDIEDMLKEVKASTKATILSFPLPEDQGDWTSLLNKVVSSYLIHHGYSSTAESFAKITGEPFREELASIKNRQKILKLVMTGRMGQAIEQTIRSYPGVLENNQNLLFMLKCRQFIEMIQTSSSSSPASSRTSPVQTSVIQSTKSYQNGSQVNSTSSQLITDVNFSDSTDIKNMLSNNEIFTPTNNINMIEPNSNHDDLNNVDLNNQLNSQSSQVDYMNDVEMENGHMTNGNSFKNGNTDIVCTLDTDEDMEVDSSPNRKTTKSGVERMLEFGRELFQMSQRLETENGTDESNQKMLEDAFSLLAYSNPWSSPLGWQLCSSRRETVCAALNSAILDSMDYSWQAPLEVCIAHASELLQIMASSSIGACGFVTAEDILQQH